MLLPLAGLKSFLGVEKTSKPNIYISTSRLYQFLLYQIACLCWLIVPIGSVLRARPIEIKWLDTLSFFNNFQVNFVSVEIEKRFELNQDRGLA